MEVFNAGEGIAWKPAAVAAAFDRLCRDPSLGFALVARADRAATVLAYVVVTYNYDLEFAGRDAFVTELFVAPEARRAGVGASLLMAAETEARRHDARALHLLVAPGNHAAEGLYRKAGYAASPRVMMTKKVNEGEPR